MNTMRQLNEQKFCGWCGSEVKYISEWTSECSGCGYICYINPSPCSNIIVARGKNVLMVKRAIEPQLGKFDLPGGFAEISDTSMEDATLRELEEELGLHRDNVSSLVYIASRKSPVYVWQNTAVQNLSFYFACKLKSENQLFDVNKSENSEMIWVKQEDLPSIDFSWGIDRDVLEQYFKEAVWTSLK